jgi:uncharacterized protein (TIGR01777 family)
MRVAVTGTNGLLGGTLTATLRAAGDDVLRLVRGTASAGDTPPDAVAWDPARGTIDAAALEGVDAVVHFAGAGIGDERWTDERREVLVTSRTGGTGLLAQTLAGLDRPPAVFVSASGVGYYGDRGDEILTEGSHPGSGFLANLCVAWEQAAQPAREAGIRTVVIRTGIVLTREGGALPKMLPLFRFGLGGPFGSGRQWMSWISLTDHLAAVRHLLATDGVEGPVNLTAPEPVTNKLLAKALGRALHRPALLPVPKFGPRLVLGRELADEMLFASQRARPDALQASGFAFAHPSIDEGLADALATAGPAGTTTTTTTGDTT